MANAIGTQVIWTLNSASQGKIRLTRMKDYKVKSDSKVEAVTEVGNDEAAAIKRKPGGYTISFNFFQQQGVPKPDWDALAASGEPVSITKQIVGGKRTQFPECYVSPNDDDGDDEGSHMLSVEITALTRKNL